MEDFFKYMEQESRQVYGWICGKCGRSNAPNVSQCPCSTPSNPWSPNTIPHYPTTSPPYVYWCGGTGSATTHNQGVVQNEGIHRFPNQN